MDPIAIAKRTIIVDGHVDVPYRLDRSRAADGSITEDVSQSTAKGDFDYPRAVAGGLDAPFMSIYVPASFQDSGGGKAMADGLIDMVEGIVARAPDKLALARSVAEVRQNVAAGKISLPLGIENGAAIENDLANLAHFHRRGVRYMTLTHGKDNLICDSSYDDRRTWKGLSPFGKQVVAEMNHVGIMIDISHVSDDAFYQVIELSRAPVIASHSSCRHFTPGFERNMDDDMIRALAKNGGVIMINFGSGFISETSRKSFGAQREAGEAFAKERGLDPEDAEVEAFVASYRREHPPTFATVDDVADHILHVIGLVGIDHVGLGSDYEGVGDSLPVGLKDASSYPNLIRVLLGRGLAEEDIGKLCSGNIFRVWQAVADHAAGAR
jgi:membrane dipeptidase